MSHRRLAALALVARGRCGPILLASGSPNDVTRELTAELQRLRQTLDGVSRVR